MKPVGDPLSGLRVCLVTPGHPSTNPRLVKEADALVAQGARVRVVHGRFLDWAEDFDPGFDGRGWRREGVWFGPRARRSRWLRQGLAQRAARALGTLGVEAAQDRAFHPVVADLAAAAAREPAQVYIGHNLAGGIAAASAARRQCALLGFDAEDDHAGELPEAPQFAAERARRQAILRRLLGACGHLTASSPRIAATLSADHGARATVVLNVFPRAEATGLAPPATTDAGDLYWASQTIGPERGLEAVVDVLAGLDAGVGLVLRGKPWPGYVETLRARLAARGGAPGRIRVEPPLAPSRVTASFHGHALALSTEVDDCRNRRDCLGNKIFHALLAGTPLLLSDTPAQRELAAGLGAAAIHADLGDPAALAARLRAWLADPAARAAASERAWTLARERYCWDVEQHAFLDALRAALARDGARTA